SRLERGRDGFGRTALFSVSPRDMTKLLSILVLLLPQVQGTALRAATSINEVEPQAAVVAHLLSVVDDYLKYYAEEKTSWTESKQRMIDIINSATTDESRLASVNEKARMKKEHDETVAEYVTVVKQLDQALKEMEGADWAEKHGVKEQLDALYQESPLALIQSVGNRGTNASTLANSAALKLRQFRQEFAPGI
ncbi:unnamed protein product, partial [Effrenium voratum]